MKMKLLMKKERRPKSKYNHTPHIPPSHSLTHYVVFIPSATTYCIVGIKYSISVC